MAEVKTKDFYSQGNNNFLCFINNDILTNRIKSLFNIFVLKLKARKNFKMKELVFKDDVNVSQKY